MYAYKPAETLMISPDGINIEPLEINVFDRFTEALKVTESITTRERQNIQDFIKSNEETVRDGLESWLTESDLFNSAYDYLSEIFPNLLEIENLANIIIELMMLSV